MRRLQQDNPNQLLRLYHIAFVIMMTIFVLGYIGIFYLQRESVNAETLINLAGRQRMLIQRISFLSVLLAESDDGSVDQNLHQAYDDALNEIQSVHQAFLAGDETLQIEAIQNPTIRQSLQDLTPLLNHLSQTTQCLAGQLALATCNASPVPSLQDTLIQQQDAYLDGMNVIVFDIEVLYRSQRLNQQRLDLIVFIAELIGFGIIGVFLLRPALKQLSQTLTELVSVRKDLEGEVRIKQALFEQSPVAMTLGLELKQAIQTNQAFCNFLGFSQQELDAIPSVDLLQRISHPDDLVREQAFIKEVISGQRSSYQMEKRYIRKDGEIVYGQMATFFIRDENGNLHEGSIHIIDISERKHLEMANRKNTALLQDAAKLATLGGWEVPLNTMLPNWSPEIKKIHEVPLDYQPDLETAINFYAPEARPIIENVVNHAIETGEGWDFELPLITAKGNRKWVRTIGGVDLEAGEPIRLFGMFQDLTKKDEARQALQHSQTLQHTLLTQLPDTAVIVFDNDMRYVIADGPFLEQAGYSRDILINRTLYDVLTPAQVERLEPQYQQVLNGDSLSFERHDADQNLHYDAKMVPWVHGKAVPLFDADGIYYEYVGTLVDITKRKLVDLEIQTQYRYQRTMTRLGMLALDTESLQTFMDQFVEIICDNLGVEYTEILELTLDKTRLFLRSGVGWHKGLVGTAYVDAGKHSQAGYTLSVSGPVIVNDLPGEARFQGSQLLTDHDVISGMSTIIHTRNEPYGVLGIHTGHQRTFSEHDVAFLQNVTGLLSSVIQFKQAEQIAIQERNLLRTIIDNVPDNIFVKDTDLRFIETNRAHANAGGVSRDDMIGHTAAEFFDETLTQQFHADDTRIVQDGQPIINQERMTTDSAGNQRWVLTSKFPLYDDGNIIGLIGISRDITERRQAEQVKFEVEQQRQLLEIKERFIATASHNFRTPLAIISSGTNLLDRYLERYSPSVQREKLDRIQQQVDYMTNLLDDILTLHKLNTDNVGLAKTQFNLQVTCQRIWGDMSTLDGDHHTKQFQYLATHTMIFADESILQQIIHNLLSNAFKYTPNGKMITFQIESDDRWFNLTVKDEGIGIPESDLSQLFQPFHRASNTSSIQGTGLGLAIVKEYVELHSGRVEVESEEGTGTSFIVHLPLNKLNKDITST